MHGSTRGECVSTLESRFLFCRVPFFYPTFEMSNILLALPIRSFSVFFIRLDAGFWFWVVEFQHSNITFVVWFQYSNIFYGLHFFFCNGKKSGRKAIAVFQRKNNKPFRHLVARVWEYEITVATISVVNFLLFLYSLFSYSQLCHLDRSAELITFHLNRMIMILPSLEWFAWFLPGTRHAVGVQHH